MQSNKPIVSICIPTYNRAEYLKMSLDSLVGQINDERVEIIISDNCSNDYTKDLCEDYAKKFGYIHYYRNPENMVGENVGLSLKRGSGKLRKLANDTVQFKAGAINHILNIAEQNIDTRPVLFFTSLGGRKSKHPIFLQGVDTFVRELSFNITWIRGIAFWEDDIDNIDILSNSESRIPQVPALLSNVQKKNISCISYKDIMTTMEVERKDLTYGLFNVFYTFFLGFIREYVDIGEISEDTYDFVRKDLLMNFFTLWIVNTERHPNAYLVGDENLRKEIVDAYGDDRYFSEFSCKLRLMEIRDKFRNIVTPYV